MFHMLSSFNLPEDVSAADFQTAIDRFHELLKAQDLVMETGPLGKRVRHPVMDTDEDRDLAYYFLMSFRDRAQCDEAVRVLYRDEPPLGEVHRAVWTRVQDAVFTCWQDI